MHPSCWAADWVTLPLLGRGERQTQQPQQQQQLHARLQYLLSHGQRYTLRQSLRQLRQEAGRRGWKWAFGAAWMQRGRLLADADRNR